MKIKVNYNNKKIDSVDVKISWIILLLIITGIFLGGVCLGYLI